MSSSSHAPLNIVHSVHYISGRNNANMSWIFFFKSLLEYPENLEICSVKSVDTLFYALYPCSTVKICAVQCCILTHQVFGWKLNKTHASLSNSMQFSGIDDLCKLGKEYLIALTYKLRTSFWTKFWNFWHITHLSIISRCKVSWCQKQSIFWAHPVEYLVVMLVVL